eukprot:906431-Amphidinium_carterae.1
MQIKQTNSMWICWQEQRARNAFKTYCILLGGKTTTACRQHQHCTQISNWRRSTPPDKRLEADSKFPPNCYDVPDPPEPPNPQNN